MKTIITAFLLIAIAFKANSQCLKDSVFVTDSIGSYTDKMPIRLYVNIKNDSIIISPDKFLNARLLVFKIISRKRCDWNSNFTYGITSYEAMPIGTGDLPKFPLVNIIYKPNGQKYIEILYEKSEPRVLSISNK